MELMDEDQIKCLQCGNSFTAKRSDAKFCSDKCKKAWSRHQAKDSNLKYEDVLIRGQHEGDVITTPHGMVQAVCRCCGQEFSRWNEAKLARLVRNEIEGLDWGPSKDMDRDRFNQLLTARLYEVKFCSDACASVGTRPQPMKVRPAKVEKIEENRDASVGKRDFSAKSGNGQAKHRGQK